MSDSDVTTPPDQVSEVQGDSFGVDVDAVIGQSWQEQDIALRALWMQQLSPSLIAEKLGRSVAAIMTRAARLGLPRRMAPGRKPGSHRVVPETEFRVSVPRPSSNKAEDKGRDTQTSPRICLMCLRPFPSLGRHNRICASCKNSSEYESAISLSEINLPI